MNENGSFRCKQGFTITGNTLTRDGSISLKAKGLYLLIMSYITYPDKILTKQFLFKQCKEGEKCFDSAWNELKEAGYLKSYFMPSKKGWKTEYELLDEPTFGAHTFYLNMEGEISSTNLNRGRSEDEIPCNERIPQKGGNADRYPHKGSNAYGSNANGGNNINTNGNTKSKTISLSIYPEEKEDGRKDNNDSFGDDDQGVISYSVNNDVSKAGEVIYALADADNVMESDEYTKEEAEAYLLAADCLVEMISCKEPMILSGSKVSYANIIDRLNEVIRRDAAHMLCIFIDMTIKDFLEASARSDIKDVKKYMKVCLFNSFSTYRIKWSMYFKQTFQQLTTKLVE